jgi:hypothetical protein
VLAENYEVVHVDVGAGDKNQDLMTEYHVPMDQGIPSVAILESDGTLIYSQKDGEFENTRRLTVEKLLDFLEEWKLKAIIRSSYLLESAGRGRVPNLLRSCPYLPGTCRAGRHRHNELRDSHGPLAGRIDTNCQRAPPQ